MKIYIHERENDEDDPDVCWFGWAENDTQAPNQVRHECTDILGHPEDHVCVCGLMESNP